MRQILYIFLFLLASLFMLQSCGIDEPINTSHNTEGYIELVARPTSYDKFDVTTKSLSGSEIEELESKIYTAYFMVFDNDGNRVVFKDLTNAISENTIPSQSLKTDKGLSNGIICFISNIPYASANSMQTVDDLSIALNYADISTGCIGIPKLIDTNKNLNVYSIPMAAFLQGDFSKVPSENTVQMSLERLMSKVIINLDIDLQDITTNKTPQFALSNCIINNMPIKVSPVKVNEDEQTRWAESTNTTDFLSTDNILTYFNLDDGEDDSNVVYQGQEAKSLFFYVPEHIVIPDLENNYSEAVRQRYKPMLFTSSSLKKPLYVSIIGDIIDEFGNAGVAKYDIYLGLNEYNDFSVLRNRIYTNNISIKGTKEVDHRVSISQGDISVSFKRATYLDSHFEVRPLRISWANTDSEANGIVKIKVLDAYDDNAAVPSWIRLERPSNISGDAYCGNIGKRKYFTTNLVTSTLAANTEIQYEISSDDSGQLPTWVYVDEYVATSKASWDITNTFETFSDAIRQARIRVEYIPAGETQPKDIVEYIVTQRSVYPVEATNQEIKIVGMGTSQKYTYGIEYFEEYLYDYDDVNIEDTEEDGFNYSATQNGMEWGLNGVYFSDTEKSVTINDVTINDESGFGDIANNLNTIKNIIKRIVTETINSDAIPFYDFYLKRENETKGNEYYGAEYNKKMLQTLSELDNDNDNINLSLTLSDTPKSIIEYCYNKNKRNADGTISTIHWYVPSVDEIEDIALSAYNDFDVFQNELYWSCQPAFNHNIVTLDGYYLKLGTGSQTTYIDGRTPSVVYDEQITSSSNFNGGGDYFTDDVLRARATKIDDTGKNVSSAVTGNAYTMAISGEYKYYYLYYEHEQKKNWRGGYYISPDLFPSTKEINDNISSDVIPNESVNYEDHPGNEPRSSNHRVRCVYDKEGFSL